MFGDFFVMVVAVSDALRYVTIVYPNIYTSRYIRVLSKKSFRLALINLKPFFASNMRLFTNSFISVIFAEGDPTPSLCLNLSPLLLFELPNVLFSRFHGQQKWHVLLLDLQGPRFVQKLSLLLLYAPHTVSYIFMRKKTML